MQLQKVDPRPAKSLVQGSIFTIDGLDFLYEGQTFTLKKFYPEVNLAGVRHGMVMSQSCDVATTDGRKIKVPYITIGFLEPFARHIRREEDWSRVALPWTFSTEQGDERYTLVCPDLFESVLSEHLSDLLENKVKNHFFVSFEDEPLDSRYYTLNITKAFPIKSGHYVEILPRVTHELTPDFAHKLGWKIAELYGRAATGEYTKAEAKVVLSELYDVIDKVTMKTIVRPVPLDKKGFSEAHGLRSSPPEERQRIMVDILQRMKKDREDDIARKEKKAARDAAYHRARVQASPPPVEEVASHLPESTKE
jgi:hypothetical protein